jgi:DNA-binding NarL/FixJ family response regulator
MTQTGNSRSVLLVCQSDNTLGALAAILHQADETALTAQNAKDAWDCVKMGSVACVVLDLTTMSGDALTLFRSVRSAEKYSRVPFLFLVRKDYKVTKLDTVGPEIARDGYLVLPCSSQLFLTAVRALLEQKSVRETQSGLPSTNNSSLTSTGTLSLLKGGTLMGMAPGSKSEADELLNAPGMLSGKLGTLDVTKLLSMFEPLKVTGTLKLTDGKRVGSVHFIEGSVRHAELNEIEGPDALFLLFHLRSGAFRFEATDPSEKRTIEGNTMALLLEGLRQMDEAKAMVMAFKARKGNAAHAETPPEEQHAEPAQQEAPAQQAPQPAEGGTGE